MQGIHEHSKDAAVFCLVHKMDLVDPSRRDKILAKWNLELKNRCYPSEPTIFATSIWDESLYRAWSSIVYSLIPNVGLLEGDLERFCKVCEAAEVVLFEKTTFLVISHTKNSTYFSDTSRFEKVSNIIKQFKLSCSKSQAQFQTVEIRNPACSIFIRPLTTNTFIMMVLSDTSIQSSLVIRNIEVARTRFTAIENV
ncbi:Interleukin-4 receptor subunit alpha [Kappamyces sp. JEL0829]|nr:Interleukin-4 receptor subunit alpha [Kappamyces sp. JEL0829]KAJ3359623.1 Interleukin-4 receptor subunit alpha [Kappamyces sp. JEL0680]